MAWTTTAMEPVDEGVTNTYYADLDQDGYGDPKYSAEACTVPFAHTNNDSDCDDGSGNINPDGVEVCNGLDDDCDGVADAEFMTGSVYTDLYNCGACGNDCTNQGYLNATPTCDASLPIPDCALRAMWAILMPIQTAATAVNAYFSRVMMPPLMGSTPTVMVGMVIIMMPFMSVLAGLRMALVPCPIQWILSRPPSYLCGE